MAGHSKWANIKHRKGAQDAKRGKIFTKILKEITVAARMGGGDPETNPRLRMAIERGKSSNLPKDNMERAIKKGTGELEGVNYEEYVYEGYGPEGVAILLDILTDNKNRTSGEVRNIFSKNGGNMAEAGAVSWNFERKGVITLENISEDEVMDLAIENGASDVESDDSTVTLYAETEDFESLKEAISAQYEIKTAEITKVPKNSVKINDANTAKRILKLIDLLEDNDDVQYAYSNFDIDEAVFEEME